jgi:DNA-binding GntR family transcriptional regulator
MQSVVDILRDSIISGDLKLGEALSERALAEKLQVSKTPVREALGQLRLEGLVRVYPQRGAYVFTPNAIEVIEMCELRQALEAAALKMSIERNPEQTRVMLSKIVDRMEKATSQQDRKAYLHEDTLFHRSFFHCCGNQLMLQTYEMHTGKISALRTHLARLPNHTDMSFEEHSQIADAVACRDTQMALSILDTHIGRTRLTYTSEVDRAQGAEKEVVLEVKKTENRRTRKAPASPD